eukprot:TRINITY_DN30773_c0_g1_i2.p1 TRINITY_DN30773_c0_g1~~TRINITY_DN30773_c0_g1_i2.p1  ORF type:complete len:591 (-),score=123.65 TRINITY_DN30773_c0_g1_i2:73-1845(-)
MSGYADILDDVAFLNTYSSEFHDGAIFCERAEGKGRILKSARAYEQGDVIFSDMPLSTVNEPAKNAAFDELCDLCRANSFPLPPLWYWCALKSLTDEELGANGRWEPLERVFQQRLLLLDHGDIAEPSEAVVAIAAQFLPASVPPLQLENLVNCWLKNAFVGKVDGLTVFFFSSLMSHSCLPSAVWHYDVSGNFVLKARRGIAAGEEVTVSYLSEAELLFHASARRRLLSDSKQFWCTCERCVGAEDDTRGVRCDRCGEGVIFAKLPLHEPGGVSNARGFALRAMRPRNFDEAVLPDASLWLTVGAPMLKRSRGRCYYEVKLGSGVAEPQIGWATELFEEADDWTGSGVGDDKQSWAADGMRHLRWHDGPCGDVQWTHPWLVGDIVGCAVDIDAGVMSFAVNGSWEEASNIEFESRGRSLFPALSMQGDFELRLEDSLFSFRPPGDDFAAPLGEDVSYGPCGRHSLLQSAFEGATCRGCGHYVGTAESRVFYAMEGSLQAALTACGFDAVEDVGASEEAVDRLEVLLATSRLEPHALAWQARRKLAEHFAKLGRHDVQADLLEQCFKHTEAKLIYCDKQIDSLSGQAGSA